MEKKVELSVFIKSLFLVIQGFLSWVLVWAGIDGEVFLILTILLIIDFVSGIWKAHTLEQSVTSNKMKYGIISKLSLLLIPVIVGLGIKAIGADAHPLLLGSMNMLILSEIYSVIGNIYCVRTGQELPEFDVLSSIAKSIRNRMMGNTENNND